MQTSTTFLHWFNERFANYDGDVDADFGQYKGDDYQLKSVGYEWRREHGKKKWSEKKRGHQHKNTILDLFSIENGGIKLPAS